MDFHASWVFYGFCSVFAAFQPRRPCLAGRMATELRPGFCRETRPNCWNASKFLKVIWVIWVIWDKDRSTFSRRFSHWELRHIETQVMMTEVTHNWGNRFSHLVRALAEMLEFRAVSKKMAASGSCHSRWCHGTGSLHGNDQWCSVFWCILIHLCLGFF